MLFNIIYLIAQETPVTSDHTSHQNTSEIIAPQYQGETPYANNTQHLEAALNTKRDTPPHTKRKIAEFFCKNIPFFKKRPGSKTQIKITLRAQTIYYSDKFRTE